MHLHAVPEPFISFEEKDVANCILAGVQDPRDGQSITRNTKTATHLLAGYTIGP